MGSVTHDVGATETETGDGRAEFRHAAAGHRADAQAPHLLPGRGGIEQARIADAGAFEHGQRALGVRARGETGDLEHDAFAGIARRRRRYLVSMSVRTACFVGAIFVGGWVRWVLLLGAFVLPYVAVVMANAASPRIPGTDLVAPEAGHRELGGS